MMLYPYNSGGIEVKPSDTSTTTASWYPRIRTTVWAKVGLHRDLCYRVQTQRDLDIRPRAGCDCRALQADEIGETVLFSSS